ncbi:unnamed protein product [Moneuplotes crassus]|uniref:Uncharacterized protein n=1 Tax=Euplotes crassus TaxID=5936 RepID=A0AAD1UB38_EUPCR|nr:unnamed protein product [Moneuplotes crassus]
MDSPSQGSEEDNQSFTQNLQNVTYSKPEKLTIDITIQRAGKCNQSISALNDTVELKDSTIFQSIDQNQPLSNDIVVKSIKGILYDKIQRSSNQNCYQSSKKNPLNQANLLINVTKPRKIVSQKRKNTNQVLKFMKSKYSIMASQEPKHKKWVTKNADNSYQDSFPCIYNYSYSDIPKTHAMRREKPGILLHDSPTNFSTDNRTNHLLNNSERQLPERGTYQCADPILQINSSKSGTKEASTQRRILKSSIKMMNGISMEISNNKMNKQRKLKVVKKIDKILNTTRRAEQHAKSLTREGKRSLREDKSTEYFKLLSMQRMKGVNLLALKNSRKSLAPKAEFTTSPTSRLELHVGNLKINHRIHNPIRKAGKTTSNKLTMRKYSENWVNQNMKFIERNLHCLQIT